MKIEKDFGLEPASVAIGLILFFAGVFYPHPSFALRLETGAGDNTYKRIINEQVLIEEQETLSLYDEKNNADHVKRVTEMVIVIANEMRLNKASIEKARRASLLHDIGRNGLDNDAVSAIKRLRTSYGINTRRKGLATSKEVIERVEKDINLKLLKGEIQETAIPDVIVRISETELKLQKHIRDNLYILLDHAERGIEVIKTLKGKIVFPVTDDILTIVRYHSYPDKLPPDTSEEIRLLTGILIAADNLETMNNKAKFGETSSKKEWGRLSLFDDAEHYGALPKMKQLVERGRIIEEAYLAIERLVYERNPDLLRLILKARETDALLPGEIKHIEKVLVSEGSMIKGEIQGVKKVNLKALFLDKADTLLPEDQQIESRNLEALVRTLESGLKVIIVTTDSKYSAVEEELINPLTIELRISGRMNLIENFHLIHARKIGPEGKVKTINQYYYYAQNDRVGSGYDKVCECLTKKEDDVIDKGRAIELLIAKLGISSGSVIVATDASKDKAMFKAQMPEGIISINVYVGTEGVEEFARQGVIVSPPDLKFTKATLDLLNYAAEVRNRKMDWAHFLPIWHPIYYGEGSQLQRLIRDQDSGHFL